MSKTRYNRVNKIETMLEVLDEQTQIKVYQNRYDRAMLALESIEDKALSNATIIAFENDDVDFVFELLSVQLEISDNRKCLEAYYTVKDFVGIKSRLEKVWRRRESEE